MVQNKEFLNKLQEAEDSCTSLKQHLHMLAVWVGKNDRTQYFAEAEWADVEWSRLQELINEVKELKTHVVSQ